MWKYNLRGAAIGGSCAGKELSDPAFHPFWAKAEALGVPVFIHPQPSGAPADLKKRLQGNGYLDNVIGNPLETTIALSHLIFDGSLDRFPKLKLIAAHGGGYLPSYAARSDIGCSTRPGAWLAFLSFAGVLGFCEDDAVCASSASWPPRARTAPLSAT